MFRVLFNRKIILVFTLLLSLLGAAACTAGGEKAASNTAASSTPVPAASAGATGQPAGSAASTAASTSSSTGPAGAKLNLNTATANDFLTKIPGMGNRMVHEFEEYRPYLSIQQFRREIGKYVDSAQVSEYEKYVFVPIAENDSDAPTLQQIPGLTASEAEELINGRPYASRDAFLAALASKVSAEEMAVARTYLVNR